MLAFIFRKIIKNKWLTLCQLVGFILAIAIVSAIPVYTDSMLQRMLIKDLEALQKENGIYPGAFTVTNGFWGGGMTQYNRIDDALKTNIIRNIGVPLLSKTNILSMDGFGLYTGNNGGKKIPLVKGIENIQNNIEIIKGRFIENSHQKNIYEAVVSEQGYNELGLSLDKEYRLKSIYKENDAINIRIVGIFREKDTGNGLWLIKDAAAAKSIIIDYNCLRDNILPVLEKPYWRSIWSFSVNYRKIMPRQVKAFLHTYEDGKTILKKLGHKGDYYFTGCSELENYDKRAQQMTATMWMLITPVLVMAVIYIYMISRLIILDDENEIALIRSRGAASKQIFANYLAKGLILSFVALAAGIPLGLLLVQVMGVSNGFLEFIGRDAVPVSFDANMIANPLIIVLIALAAMLIPAFKAAKKSIVEYKRRKTAHSWWQGIIGITAAVLLLAVCAYGIFRYRAYMKSLPTAGANTADKNADPVFFVVSSMFSIGIAILVILIYPYVLRLLLYIGKRFWPPCLYASLVYTSRTDGGDRLVMLFLIFSLSTGIFSANTARTINRNMEDRIYYSNGADITLTQKWRMYARAVDQSERNLDKIMLGTGNTQNIRNVRYEEPPFDIFKNLPGVEAAARVLVKDEAGVFLPNGSNMDGVRVIGISPAEYGRVVWSRGDLLQHHINDYLNLMADSRNAVLLSFTFKEKFGIKEGDIIYFTWSGQEPVEVIVYGFVDCWPCCSPVRENGGASYLIVADIDYIYKKLAKEPYEVWLRKKNGVSDAGIRSQLNEAGIQPDKITYSGQEIIKSKNDPLLQGINGLLTLDFIIAIVISAIGSLIFWIISLKKRILQFGLFRAMGMYRSEITVMLIFEQILVTGISILTGIAVGAAESALFIPFIQVIYSAAEKVPPFIVTAARSDYIKIYSVLASIMVAQICTMSKISANMRIDKALKMGEE